MPVMYPQRSRFYGSLGVLLVLLVGLQSAACGADVRQKALRSSLISINAAQAGFVAWDDQRQQEIVEHATTREAALADIAYHDQAIEPIVVGFELTYHLLAAAALDPTDVNVIALVQQVDRLYRDIERMTGAKSQVPVIE